MSRAGKPALLYLPDLGMWSLGPSALLLSEWPPFSLVRRESVNTG